MLYNIYKYMKNPTKAAVMPDASNGGDYGDFISKIKNALYHENIIGKDR